MSEQDDALYDGRRRLEALLADVLDPSGLYDRRMQCNARALPMAEAIITLPDGRRVRITASFVG